MTLQIQGAAELAPNLEVLERREAAAEWFATRIRPVAHEVEVRDYQLDIWRTLADARESGKTKDLLALATGLGKTLVAAVDTVKFCDECRQAEVPMYPRVLYVSHIREINEQAENTFRKVMPDADMQHIDPSRAEDFPESDVDFALVQGLFRNLHRFDPEAYEAIIWDEAHHTEAATYRAVREYFRPLYELAITATADRMDGQDIREYFGEPVYEKGLAEAIAEGWLTRVDYHIVLDKTIKATIEQGHPMETMKDIRALFGEKPPREVLAQSIRDEIEKLGLEDPKTMVFCDSIAEADEMAGLLDGTALHSRSKDRGQKMEDFRLGRNRRMFTKDLFNEGVDVPDVDLVIFLRATESNNIFLQQLGRGLRLSPGKNKVTVLDFVANIERIGKVRELSQAVQGRANELHRAASERSSDGKLHVHTDASDFDFDKIAVDLLARFDALKRPTAPVASGEYYSINSAYQRFGIGPAVLEKIIDEMGWDLPLRKFGPQTVRAISLAQIDQLRLTHPDAFAPPVPEGWLSIRGVANELGVDFYTVKRIVDGSNWDLPRHKFKGGTVSVAFSPERVDEIRRHPNITAPSLEDDTIVSVAVLARELGMAPDTLKDVADRHGITVSKHRFGKGRTRGEGFTGDEAARLRDINAPVQTELLSTKDAAKALGIHYQTVVRLIGELGLELQERRAANGRRYLSLSPQQIQIIRESERFRLLTARTHLAQRPDHESAE